MIKPIATTTKMIDMRCSMRAGEEFRKALIEYRYQLKSEQCLYAGKHHAGFLDHMVDFLLERFPLLRCLGHEMGMADHAFESA